MVYTDKTPLSSIILDNPAVLSLLNRLGIYLGVGNKTVGQTAQACGLDPNFLLVLINTSLNRDYFPEKELMSFPLRELCDYLLRTNQYYLQVQIPNVGRHFRHLVEHSFSPDTNLNRLFDYFLSLQKQMRADLEEENHVISRAIIPRHDGASQQEAELAGFASNRRHPSTDSLFDLANLFIIHLKGTCEPNLCQAVITALISLAEDMRRTNRIHERILSPLLLRRLSE